MKRITIAVLLLSTAVGCSTSQSATGGRAAREGSGTVTGVITLAEELGPKTGDFCSGLTVQVSSPSVPGESLGSRMVRTSRGRCSYEITHLPSGGPELQLSVTPPSTWQCGNGGTPTLNPAQQTLKLRDYQADTRDFRVSCETAAPAQATPSAP